MEELFRKHEELKKKIHAFRIPLPPMARRFMGVVYLSIPLVCGYFIMSYVQKKSIENIGLNGSKLNKSEMNDATIAQNKVFGELLLRLKEEKNKVNK